MSTVSIKGLTKASVLAALYNRSVPLGLGQLHSDTVTMSEKEAETLLVHSSDQYFDYLKGRVMKLDFNIDVETEELYVGLYNRDIGEGVAEHLISQLRLVKSKENEEA